MSRTNQTLLSRLYNELLQIIRDRKIVTPNKKTATAEWCLYVGDVGLWEFAAWMFLLPLALQFSRQEHHAAGISVVEDMAREVFRVPVDSAGSQQDLLMHGLPAMREIKALGWLPGFQAEQPRGWICMTLGDGSLPLEQVWVGNDQVFSLAHAEFVPALSFNTVQALNCSMF